MTIWLDMDGVLADFDLAAATALGMSVTEYDHTYGHHASWKKLAPVAEFFASIPLIPDAEALVAGIRRYSEPKVLTALPIVDGQAVADAKIKWIWNHWPMMTVQTCLRSEKAAYCLKGDVLIDDHLTNRKRWMKQGGIFIQHKNAEHSLRMLEFWIGGVK